MACTHEAIALFEEDIEYQWQAGFCKVIPWEELKQLHPPNLKISPVAAVPQVGHCPCIILDLSFPVYQDIDGIITATQASVNDTMALQAPKEAVHKGVTPAPDIYAGHPSRPPHTHVKARHQRWVLVAYCARC
jgi:hypothetical protein